LNVARAVEDRFLGNGNVWLGRYRGWQIKCSRCSTTKTISSHGNNSLPPKAILKKLAVSGWRIGNKSEEDICKECQRKPLDTSLAKKALASMTAPIVGDNQHRLHFDEVVRICKTLPPDRARELIGVLRESLPKRPPPKPKPILMPESDTDYVQWLSEQDKQNET
jgi:hypothetical protein